MSISLQGERPVKLRMQVEQWLLERDASPAIYIFAGEKVCVEAITPMHRSELFAARICRQMPSASVRTG